MHSRLSNRLQTGTDQDFHLQNALVQASLLLKHQPTGQLKRMRPLTSYPASQSRVLLTNYEAGHMFSPTRKVGSAFFRTHVYCDSSPCFADPALLLVVGFCGLKSCRLSITQRTRPLTSSPVSQSRVFPTKSRSWSHVFIDQEGRNCVFHNLRLL